MDKQNHAKVCYCKDCKQLDYAIDKCPNCGSSNITVAYQDFLIGYGRHVNLMQSVYEQHYDRMSKELKQFHARHMSYYQVSEVYMGEIESQIALCATNDVEIKNITERVLLKAKISYLMK